jgi:hypothetical protein
MKATFFMPILRVLVVLLSVISAAANAYVDADYFNAGKMHHSMLTYNYRVVFQADANRQNIYRWDCPRNIQFSERDCKRAGNLSTAYLRDGEGNRFLQLAAEGNNKCQTAQRSLAIVRKDQARDPDYGDLAQLVERFEKEYAANYNVWAVQDEYARRFMEFIDALVLNDVRIEIEMGSNALRLSQQMVLKLNLVFNEKFNPMIEAEGTCRLSPTNNYPQEEMVFKGYGTTESLALCNLISFCSNFGDIPHQIGNKISTSKRPGSIVSAVTYSKTAFEFPTDRLIRSTFVIQQ